MGREEGERRREWGGRRERGGGSGEGGGREEEGVGREEGERRREWGGLRWVTKIAHESLGNYACQYTIQTQALIASFV